MEEYAHVEPSVRPAVTLTPEERIHRLRQPHWIAYPRAKGILDKLEDLLSFPQTHRMPNLLIVGDTNNGKTVIVSRFQRLHPANDNATGDHAHVPVLLIQAPPAPDEGQFYCAILEALGAPYRRRSSAGEKQFEVLAVLRTIGIRMLIIDEIHHILAGHLSKQRMFLNVLKYVGNELRIPLIGVGTIDAVRAVQTDAQMANRFEPVGLPRWEMGREFQTLLASFERLLPLKNPSCLAEPVLAAKLLALSDGIIGELSQLLAAAATQAIRSGKERIDEHVLAKVDWIPPSARRHEVEKLM